jgi:hypothetical protein
VEEMFERGIVLLAVEVVEAVESLEPWLAGVDSWMGDSQILERGTPEGGRLVAFEGVRIPHFPSEETASVGI